jgi:hypothetical protein
MIGDIECILSKSVISVLPQTIDQSAGTVRSVQPQSWPIGVDDESRCG